MRVRRTAALDRHLLSVSLRTSSLCDTSSHVFTVMPAIMMTQMVRVLGEFTKISFREIILNELGDLPRWMGHVR